MRPTYKLVCAAVIGLSTTTAFADEWKYDVSTDAMRGTTKKSAVLLSDNSVSPGSYYASNTTLAMVIRDDQKRLTLYVTANPRGQLWCQYNNCTVAIKFDDEKPVNWSMAKAEAGHSDTLFFNNESRLLAKLKNSKKAIVEVMFYDKGTYQFTFKTAGLSWGAEPKKNS
jgi:hypothetical protein